MLVSVNTECWLDCCSGLFGAGQGRSPSTLQFEFDAVRCGSRDRFFGFTDTGPPLQSAVSHVRPSFYFISLLFWLSILSEFFQDFSGIFSGIFFSGDFSPLLSATFLMICFIFVCFQLVEIFPLCFLLFLSRCHAPRSCKILGGSFEDSLTFPRSQRSRATCNHKSFIISGFQGFFFVVVVAVDTVAFLNIS